ncbi:MAG: aspartate--tRNA ligase [Gemmatimonadales bacterium]
MASGLLPRLPSAGKFSGFLIPEPSLIETPTAPNAPFATSQRTHRCGVLTRAEIGQRVRLAGWVHRRRDLGGIVFIDLRDHAGLVQLSCDPSWTPAAAMAAAASTPPETVVAVEGTVALRREPARDATMATREIEVQVSAFTVIGPAVTPAIPVARREGEELASEEMRLQYRVLDLRRPELQTNLVLRHRLLQAARRTMSDLGFLEIETPILTKPTPEGARDYLVPSRVHPGEFYALPQSPQIYKQLLMIAGYDRYFQLARCFRDEDLRADRQPEFTQIDLEASFVGQDDVLSVVEQVLAALWREAGETVALPFPQLTYADALERFGIDKPDLRFGFEIVDVTSQVQAGAAEWVHAALEAGGRVRAILAPGLGTLSRKELDALGELTRAAGACGLIWARRTESGWEGQGVKALPALSNERPPLPCEPGTLLVAVAGADAVTGPGLHAVRSALIERSGAAPSQRHAFVWVVDFPLFEKNAETGEWVFTHHPFTSPHPDDVALLDSEPWRCRARHYDAVYNGNELGSGSIRITDPKLQATIFRLIGIDDAQQRSRFGFLLDALAAGAPPHGGFALGFDRIAMLLAGATSLRDVIAFPKTATARALFEGAPTSISGTDLAALRLRSTADRTA